MCVFILLEGYIATAEQIKSLIRSHLDDEPERFFSIALQVAAHEASLGHGALAYDIRLIVDKARQKARPKILKFPKDLQGLVLSETSSLTLSSLVLPDDLMNRIRRIVHEYRQQDKLKKHGLSHRRKILLIGPPGTGKTMTARVLAHEVRMDLHTVQVDKMVTRFMGETSAKLRQVFDLIQSETGVYFFDEFDAIGGERTLDNDVGEMRRVLNAFLQFIEQDVSDSLIVAATNSPKILDRALYRRFDDVLYYHQPEKEERRRLIQNVLGEFLYSNIVWEDILKETHDLSHAEIDYACRDSIKQAILNDQTTIEIDTLEMMFHERMEAHKRRNQ